MPSSLCQANQDLSENEFLIMAVADVLYNILNPADRLLLLQKAMNKME